MYNTIEDKERLITWFKEHTKDETLRKFYGAYMAPIFVQAFFAVTQAHQEGVGSMGHGMFFQNFTKEKEFNWLWYVEEMQEFRESLFVKLEKDTTFGNKFFDKYMEKFAAFDLGAKELEKVDQTGLADSELVDRLLKIITLAGGQCSVGYAVDSLLSFSDDDWFAEYSKKYLGRELSDEELAILREPTHRSFVNEFQLRLLEAAAKKQTEDNIDCLVAGIAKDYYWIENNYIRMTTKDEVSIRDQIDEIESTPEEYEKEKVRLKKVVKQKEGLLDKIGAPEIMRVFVAMADSCIAIQDYRKQAVLRLNHFLFTYFDELAARTNFDSDLIKYVMFFELKDLLENPKKFEKVARERKNGCLALYDKDGCAILLKKDVEDIDLEPFFKDYSDVMEVKGMPASPGRVRAKARVVLGSDQFENFKEGEILITNQTTPDFVPLMKKAAAIIAEQGGVTSHAAIVSRELGIPCVVGVKDAMAIFVDGEDIEVDAYKGVVKKF